ncbi:uncharacterized protein N0V89_003074 [Didymosphaeria variabile]|uniref:PHD-type domain-containing protein n=1 Tax=Didymosphaeria variabile TaxID=1932322 RepID=A0A9W9CF10_9PLEO|nr:uncharacterized protein N0V89_003074 [Didymosphaeria variabile]KAJ4358490.1 hypothetical protein N0V89_003074 [Didymosphaeria variabile]
MAPLPGTPRPRVRSSGRPLKRTISDSAPPLKKRKYIPGGPGGGGRYVDEDGIETPVGGTGPGGYAYTGPRGRIGRMNAEAQGLPLDAPSPSYSRPRRERPPAGPRSSSAAAVAAAVAQHDGYKPREERGWEEFHQTLDIDLELPIFSADQVDGTSPPESAPGTPINGFYTGQYAIDSGVSAQFEGIRAQQASQDASTINGVQMTPRKRGPGRPPRKIDSMLNGLGSPPRPRINPLPTMNPKEKLNLPKPSTRQVETFKAYEESEAVKINYVDRTMASIGYQESEIFAKPEKALIRVPEGSIEEDLDLTLQSEGDGSSAVGVGRVEYDMDEQDDRWLDTINAQRRDEGVEAIKPAIFEVTITQIEKEWHALEKRKILRLFSAASCLTQVQGYLNQTRNPHKPIDHVPAQQLQLMESPQAKATSRIQSALFATTVIGCIFCPNIDGAFKQTTAMKWAHLLCAMWIPEVSLANTTFQEPVQDVEKVPKTRWKLTCYICKQKMGACIQCGHKSCFEAFHVTCARKARLCLKMKSSSSQNPHDASVLKAYCDRHSPSDWRRENDVDGALAEAKYFYRQTMRHVRWGDSQAYALSIGSTHPIPSVEGPEEDDGSSNRRRRPGPAVKSWRLPSGAPVVPHAVYHNVENSLIRFNVRKRKEFVQEACKYWTLKREARRGAALIKRLQLQLDAFSSMEITRRNFAGMGAVGRPRLQRRIHFAELLEDDMESILIMCETVKKREAERLKDVMILRNMLDAMYFPISPLLEPILERAAMYDNKDIFKEGLLELQTRLAEKFYTSVQAFSEDMVAVFSSVIGFAAIVDVSDAEQQLGGGAHNLLTAEQKEKKKLAKRIIKGIQPLFDDAMHKESDLAGRPFEREVPNLEAILDQKLRTRPFTSASTNGVHGSIEDGASGGAVQAAKTIMDGVAAKGDETMPHAPTPEELSEVHRSARDEAADEAAIAAQLGQDTMQIVADPEPMDVDGVQRNNTTAAPPTPPGSDQDLLGPIHHGGVPWYMKEFDPEGTTVYEERWPGRDVLRDMSEELSELDDDELNGLAGSEAMIPESVVSEELQEVARNKRNRNRGLR